MQNYKLVTTLVLITCFMGTHAKWYNRAKDALGNAKDATIQNIKDGTKEGIKEGAKEIVKVTAKEAYSEVFLKPIVIKNLKKALGQYQEEKAKKEVALLFAMTESLEHLKNAGASKKELAKAHARILAKFNQILDSINKDKDKDKGPKK